MTRCRATRRARCSSDCCERRLSADGRRGPLRGPRRHRAGHAEPAAVPQRAELGDDLRARRRLRPGRGRRRGRGDRAGRRRRALLRRARHRHPGPRRRHVVRRARRCCGGTTSARPGARRRYAREMEVYLGMCRRWREIPKPDDRDGAGRLHRRRADARLGVRPDRRVRRRVLRRPGGADGDSGRGVLRAPVGARAPVRQGDPVHRRPVHGLARVRAGHGQPGRAARGAGGATFALADGSPRCRRSAWRWPSGR